MSAASEALADVRGWMCDNLSAGDAGKVCGMLSVVSRHIAELEEENAKLKEHVRWLKKGDVLHVITDQELADQQRHEREMRASITALDDENAKLRKLARGLNWCTENAKVPSAECEYCPLGDAGYGELSCERLMRELGIEAE